MSAKIKDLGKRIRQTRQEAKDTQDKFGSKVGLCVSSISSIEIGDSFPSLDALVRIARAYGKSLDWLIFGDPMKSPDQKHPPEPEILLDEYKLLQLFRSIGKKNKRLLLSMAEALTKEEVGEKEKL